MLTALYVPGNRPDRFAKASVAELTVLDLEDAVPVDAKAAARADVVAWLSSGGAAEVRVNALDTPWGADDLAALRVLGPVRVRLPKVSSAEDVHEVLKRLPEATATCLLETPLGVENAFAIASCDPRVTAIGLGESDLASSLGVDGDAGLAWSRGRVVSASRAAGLGAPMMSVYPQLHDLDGLRHSCLLGRSLGFSGRAAIHPRQLPVIVETFTPSDGEVRRARALLDAVPSDGGVVVLDDGRMADPAMIGRACELVALADPQSPPADSQSPPADSQGPGADPQGRQSGAHD